MYHSLTATLRCDRCAELFEVDIEIADACTSGDNLIDATMHNLEGDLKGQAMGDGEHACPKCYSMVLAAYDDRMDSGMTEEQAFKTSTWPQIKEGYIPKNH